MGFKEQQAAIQKELDRFIDLLNVLLPRYEKLLNSKSLNQEELHELGEMEHFLIGVTARVTEIKELLEKDIFGHSLDLYYQLKKRAERGDSAAEQKMLKLREGFHENLKSGNIILWN